MSDCLIRYQLERIANSLNKIEVILNLIFGGDVDGGDLNNPHDTRNQAARHLAQFMIEKDGYQQKIRDTYRIADSALMYGDVNQLIDAAFAKCERYGLETWVSNVYRFLPVEVGIEEFVDWFRLGWVKYLIEYRKRQELNEEKYRMSPMVIRDPKWEEFCEEYRKVCESENGGIDE